ncbi:MAG: DEAD/DEAH box helicase [Pirellulales bacterium]|nr:DEAD/DEAH box helicase [Pirellulales bacterium]
MKVAQSGPSSAASGSTLRLRVTPRRRLIIEPADPADGISSVALPQAVAAAITRSMAEGEAAGLLALVGLSESVTLPPAFAFFRTHARHLVTALGHLTEDDRVSFGKARKDSDLTRFLPPSDDDSLAASVAEAPPMPGLEYLSAAQLRDIWLAMARVIQERSTTTQGGLAAVLEAIDPQLHLLGRVTFHLAENRRNDERPFAFLATYAHRPSGAASLQHLPLAKAIEESADRHDQAKLVELLTPVRTAASHSQLIREWLESRAIFTPQAITIAEAHRFLSDVPAMEASGLAVRVPDWWRARQRSRPTVQVQIGDRKPAEVGVEALLDFSVGLALDGEPLSAAESRALLAGSESLALLRGRWVEVDRTRLQQVLDQWQQLRRDHADGIDFVRGMRLLAGADIGGGAAATGDAAREWSTMAAGAWLRESLAELRAPADHGGCTPGADLAAPLRPYQAEGVRWLWLLSRLRLGACLADDMGLGKTVQVIDLFLRLRADDATTPAGRSPRSTARPPRSRSTKPPSLLIVPASLLGNWKQELARFAPQLSCLFVHRSECSSELLDGLATAAERELRGHDVVVTTYALAKKLSWLTSMAWRLVVLDEAQAIKNPSSAQTKAIKQLRGEARIALTGTPVENHLGDLWSLFDFCCPGLLGSAGEFSKFVRNLGKQPESHGFAALRRLVQPYILRRLKTDPQIAPDLPAKTVMRTECGLSRKQAALYERTVNDLRDQLKQIQSKGRDNDIQRKGIVLATTMRLKQICNHPDQGLPSGSYAANDSGKFLRLAEICGPIAARQEKVLVFTQFQTLCEPLAGWLAEVFGDPGVVLHGKVPVARRKELVRRFQENDDVPFFVISLKAGGTGLNLTAASHVVHFDRWWNPAVENQATDRAFRIGQKKNVLVHAFVCRGTVEERIDGMLRHKQQLADQILGPTAAGETLLTEMSDEQLLDVLTLDVNSALAG